VGRHSGVVFAAAHWLIEMGDDVIESIFGEAGKFDQEYSWFIDTMRDAAEDVGELPFICCLRCSPCGASSPK